MADAAAARREARRRRILENSQDRLQRIAGSTTTIETSRGASPAPVEIPATYEESSTHLTTHLPTPLYNGFDEPVSPLHLEELLHDAPEINDFLENLSRGGTSLISPASGEINTLPALTTWERLSATKLDIILVSLLVQVMYAVFWMGTDSFSIFVPLMVYEVTKQWALRGAQQPGMVSTVLIMNGLSPKKVQSIMFVANILLTFAQDTFVYLFFTICMQSLVLCFFGNKISLA